MNEGHAVNDPATTPSGRIRSLFRMDARISAVVLLLVMLVGMLPIFMIAPYNHPAADDFEYAVETHAAVQEGVSPLRLVAIAAVTSARWMQTWQGLYSSGFIAALQPGIFGERYYALTVFIMLFFLAAGMAAFFRAFYKYALGSDSRSWVFVAAATLFFFVQTLPSPVEGLFWVSGAANYTLFWALLLLCISELIVYTGSTGRRAAVAITLSTALAFFVAGGNHVTTFACILISLGFVVVVFARKLSKKLVVLPFIASSVGFYIVMSAPGTAVRASRLNYEASVPTTLVNAAAALSEHLIGWFSLALICLLLVLTPFIIKVLGQLGEGAVSVIRPRMLALGVFASVFLLYAMECVPQHAMGFSGSPRLHNVLYATFLVLLILNYSLLLALVFRRFGHREAAEKAISDNGMIVFALSLACLGFIVYAGGNNSPTSTSGYSAKALLDGSAKTYSDEMDERYALYQDESIKRVVVKPLTVKPVVLFFHEISIDDEYWANLAVARYYGKDTVALEEVVTE